VTCLAWRPNSPELASGGPDRLIKCWETNTGRERVRYPYPPESATFQWGPNALSWTADGTRLVVAGVGDFIQIWETDSDHLLRSFRYPAQQFVWVAWKPGSQSMIGVAGLEGSIGLVDTSLDEPNCIDFFPQPPNPISSSSGSAIFDDVNVGAFSPDGKLCAMGGYRSLEGQGTAVDVYSIEPMQLVYSFTIPERSAIYHLDWCPDGRYLAVGSRQLYIHDMMARRWLLNQPTPGAVLEIAWNPTGDRLAYGGIADDSQGGFYTLASF
jgi:WD40 repeat protein